MCICCQDIALLLAINSVSSSSVHIALSHCNLLPLQAALPKRSTYESSVSPEVVAPRTDAVRLINSIQRQMALVGHGAQELPEAAHEEESFLSAGSWTYALPAQLSLASPTLHVQ